jgi:hypothetical protein
VIILAFSVNLSLSVNLNALYGNGKYFFVVRIGITILARDGFGALSVLRAAERSLGSGHGIGAGLFADFLEVLTRRC